MKNNIIMKSMNKFFATCLGILLVLSSCETTELDLTTNPNALDPSQADADFFLNAIQEDFATWTHNFGNIGSDLTRITYMYGRTYQQVYSPNTFDYYWETAYQGMLEDIRLMKVLAAERPYALGMVEVFEAYIYLTLVDYFGDVPQSEALDANNGVLNPSVSAGADVYAHAIAKLTSAEANFATGGGAPANDFYYNGDGAKWIKAARSLKKQAYWITSDLSAYNAVNNYITDPADDFQFNWGTNEAQPDTRHPDYRSSYTPTGGGSYMSNWLMDTMLTGAAGVADPRLKYYFYRQVSGTPGFDGVEANEEVLECGLPGYFNPYATAGIDVVFCAPGSGFWGRDHGNDNGTPPDGFQRTLHGVYPAGGKFDDRTYESQKNGAGKGGAGITPIMLSSWMHYMNAYVAGVDTQEAQNETLAGLADSLAKVGGFAGSTAMPSTDSESYTNGFISDWTAAGTAEKANLWAKQYWISLYGNGTNAYNTYRKTGLPTDVQPNIEPSPGAFPVSMWYPNSFVSRNQTATQKTALTGQVFWNTNGPTNLK
jgi:hypothetical protein